MRKLTNFFDSSLVFYAIADFISKFTNALKRSMKTFKREMKESSYDWDFYYLLKAIEYKLIDMKDYFSTSDIAYENKNTAREIEIALNLLHTYFDTEDMKFTVCEFDKDADTEYEFTRYVNVKNARRYVKDYIANTLEQNEEDPSEYQMMKEELYKAKCLNLFFRWTESHFLGWWD